MSAPTPRPWHAPGMGEIHCCHDDDGHTDHTGHATSRYVRVHAPGAMCEDTDEIIVADGCTDADADLIVRAVNAHDAALAVVRCSRSFPSGSVAILPPTEAGIAAFWQAIRDLHAALTDPTTPRRSEP